MVPALSRFCWRYLLVRRVIYRGGSNLAGRPLLLSRFAESGSVCVTTERLPAKRADFFSPRDDAFVDRAWRLTVFRVGDRGHSIQRAGTLFARLCGIILKSIRSSRFSWWVAGEKCGRSSGHRRGLLILVGVSCGPLDGANGTPQIVGG